MTPQEMHEGTQLILHYVLVLEGIIGFLMVVLIGVVGYIWRGWAQQIRSIAENSVTKKSCEGTQNLIKANHREIMTEVKENRRLIIHHQHDERGKTYFPPNVFNSGGSKGS